MGHPVHPTEPQESTEEGKRVGLRGESDNRSKAYTLEDIRGPAPLALQAKEEVQTQEQRLVAGKEARKWVLS